MELPSGSLLYADASRGIYIPQFFARSVRRELVAGVGAEDWDALAAGPGDDPESSAAYWDAWDRVECDAILMDEMTGRLFRLYQDGDLWCVPCDASGDWTETE